MELKEEILNKHLCKIGFNGNPMKIDLYNACLDAMEEYRLKLILPVVVRQSEQLKAFLEFCEDNYSLSIPDRIIKDYEQSL